eukprot:1384323-Amorphochlora_amoeboformis.AAC.1
MPRHLGRGGLVCSDLIVEIGSVLLVGCEWDVCMRRNAVDPSQRVVEDTAKNNRDAGIGSVTHESIDV